MFSKFKPRLFARRLQSTVAAVKRSSRPSNKSFLPEAYACHQQWDSYFQSQIDRCQLNPRKASELLIAAIDHAGKGGKFHELDIDTLALGIGGDMYDERELDYYEENILPAFRRGPRASMWLESTPAIISKYYMENKYFKSLGNLVGNKDNFGIFPDHISYCHILDSLISQNKKGDAAYFAVEWMLQEEQTLSKLANRLSLLACWNRALDLGKFELDLTLPGEEDDEEEVIRVNFLTNPHNDLHFDLTLEHHRVGKTLLTLGQLHGNLDCFLVGSALFEQYSGCLDVITKSTGLISAEAFDKFEMLLGVAETREDVEERWDQEMDEHIDRILVERKISNDERAKLAGDLKAVKQSLARSGRLVTDPGFVENELAAQIQQDVTEEAKRDISIRETQLLQEWPKIRDKMAKAQLYEAGRSEAIASARQKLADMREKMEILAFFQNKEEIRVRKWMGEAASKKAEAEKAAKEEWRRSRRWKKPEVKREETRPNVGLYPIRGV